MEMWSCDNELLNDTKAISSILEEAVRASGAHKIFSYCRQFCPQGVTGVIVVEESHFSVHTWPESGYAAIDAYTCGTKCDPMKSVDVFQKGLKAQNIEVREIQRGVRE